MSAQTSLEQQLATDWPPLAWGSLHVVVAVSGGADSVALLRAMHAVRGRFISELLADQPQGQLIVAHIDHSLREDSRADAKFVEQLACELGCRRVTRSVDVDQLANSTRDGLEAAARECRYRALLEVAHEVGARYLVTAHTAADQAETVLHRILRGTSVTGLAGIPRTRPLSASVTLMRPLLGTGRREIEHYLHEIGQAYRTDATNLSSDFTRNRIRNELLPQLAADFNPAVVDALLRLGQSAAESQQTLEHLTRQLSQRVVICSTSTRVEIDCEKLADASLHLRSLVIHSQWSLFDWPQQAMTREHWLRLAQMTLAEHAHVGPVDFPSGVVAKKEAGQLVLTRL